MRLTTDIKTGTRKIIDFILSLVLKTANETGKERQIMGKIKITPNDILSKQKHYYIFLLSVLLSFIFFVISKLPCDYLTFAKSLDFVSNSVYFYSSKRAYGPAVCINKILFFHSIAIVVIISVLFYIYTLEMNKITGNDGVGVWILYIIAVPNFYFLGFSSRQKINEIDLMFIIMEGLSLSFIYICLLIIVLNFVFLIRSYSSQRGGY